MTDDPKTLRICLDRLVGLVELMRQVPPEDRTRLERMLKLVSRALQTVARIRQQTQDEGRLREAAEVTALYSQIEEMRRLAGFHIRDDAPPVAAFPPALVCSASGP
jgi:hypothetical protein